MAVGLLNIQHLVQKFLHRVGEELDSDLRPVRNSELVWDGTEYGIYKLLFVERFASPADTASGSLDFLAARQELKKLVHLQKVIKTRQPLIGILPCCWR